MVKRKIIEKELKKALKKFPNDYKFSKKQVIEVVINWQTGVEKAINEDLPKMVKLIMDLEKDGKK